MQVNILEILEMDTFSIAGVPSVGAKVVNAVSEWFQVKISRDGLIHQIKFARGKTVKNLEIIGETKSTGTCITFKPDPEIFKQTTEFKKELIVGRLQQMAYLYPGLEITFVDKRTQISEPRRYYYEKGSEQFILELRKSKNLIHPA